VHVENEGRFQALPPDAYFVRVRLGRSIQRIRGSRGVTVLSRPDYKDLRDFARLTKAFNRGFEPRTSNRYYRYLHQHQ